MIDIMQFILKIYDRIFAAVYYRGYINVNNGTILHGPHCVDIREVVYPPSHYCITLYDDLTGELHVLCKNNRWGRVPLVALGNVVLFSKKSYAQYVIDNSVECYKKHLDKTESLKIKLK